MLEVMSTPALLIAENVKFTVIGTLSPTGAPNVTELIVVGLETVPWFSGSLLAWASTRSAILPVLWQRTQVSFAWAVGPGGPGGPGPPGAPGAPGVPGGPG